MGEKERIKLFINEMGMSVREFELRCDLGNAYINNMRRGFGRDKLEQVLNEFPQLNREWLLHGEGEMIIDKRDQANEPEVIYQRKNKEQVERDAMITISNLSETVKSQQELINMLCQKLLDNGDKKNIAGTA